MIVIVAGGIGAVLAAQVEWWMGLVIAFIVGHFFLFCNVLRAARPLELAWSAVLLSIAGSTITMQWPGWSAAFGMSLVATVLVIVLQLRKSSYHGFGWQRINPGLPQWWEKHGHKAHKAGDSKE